ncbi:TlpA family protein disulfide reductase [Candidatus Poribacteria bacterium]|nr:TlpA family protein disulfide reductase [Candidatus Poribacteria bacterium]
MIQKPLKHKRSFCGLLILFLFLCIMIGYIACAGTEMNPPQAAADKALVSSTDVMQLITEAQAGQIVPIDESQVKPLIESFKGKVVLVNLWATWCLGCAEEFPDLVKLYQQYHPQGLEILALSFDKVDSRQSRIEPFLKANQVHFPTFVKQTPNDKAFIAAIDKKWPGVLPSTFIYDQSGQLVTTFNEKQNLESFVNAIKSLIQ